MTIPVKKTLGAMRHLLPDPSSWDLFDLPDVELPEGRWLELPRRGRTWLTDVPGPTPDAPTIILLHAVGCTGQLTWFPSIPELAKHLPGHHVRPALARARHHVRAVPHLRLRRRRRRRDRRPRARQADRRRLLDGIGRRAARLAPAPRRRRRAHPRREHGALPHQRPRTRLPRRHGAQHGTERDAVTLARRQPRQRRHRRGHRRRRAPTPLVGPCASSGRRSAWAVGQAVASLGRHHSSPWLSHDRRAHRRSS